MRYKLLEPVKIGKSLAKNRIVMAPMETRLSTMSGDVTEAMIDYYAVRAKGQAGTVIFENTFVDALASRSSLVSAGIYSDHLIAGKNRVAEAIHENGALAIMQLSHGGRQAREGATVYDAAAPSDLTCSITQRRPHVLTIDEILAIEDAFAEAADRAKMAGFDGVEIHGAHGYLLCSFLSPLTNRRKDAYGGSLQNRGRLAAQIIRKAREKTGEDFIIGYRISGSEYIKGGLQIQEACEFIASIQHRIDYAHVSAGIYESPCFWSIAPTYIPPGQLVPLAAQMKKAVDIPVIAVGSLDHKIGEAVLREGQADLVAFGRALIADPFMPKKLMEQKEEDIRPCIRGNEGCISRFYTGCPIRCEVNPACGREARARIKKAREKKKVLVIGGGIAGMEAARIAALMGHAVTLVEKEKRLGGHLIESTRHDFKKNEAALLAWITRQIKKSPVDVRLHTEADASVIGSFKPDLLIVATGSRYMMPAIPGSGSGVMADRVLADTSLAGSKVIIIGGGLVGAETALALALEGRKVTLLEMTGTIAQKHEPSTRAALVYRLEQEDVKVLTRHEVLEVGPGHVLAKDPDDTQVRLEGDTIILAAGLESLKTEGWEGLVPKTVYVGDCIEPRKIYACMHEAWAAVIGSLSDELIEDA